MLSMAIEQEIIEQAGHEMGCWEHSVEELIEAAAEAGIELEGRHDELYRGVTLIDRVINGLNSGRIRCRCQVSTEAEAGWPVED